MSLRAAGVLRRSAVLLLLAGCGRATETASLWPALDAGAILPAPEGVALVRQTTGGERGSGFWIPRPVVPEDGWGRADFGWRPVGERSTLSLVAPDRWPAELVLRFRDRRRGGPQPVTVTVSLDGRALGRVELTGGAGSGRFLVDGASVRGPHRVELRFGTPMPRTDRQLVGLSAVGFVPPGDRFPGRGERPAHAEPPETAGVERVLRLDRGERLAAWVRAHDATRLALDVRFPGPEPPAGALVVGALDPGSHRREVARVDAGDEPGWRRVDVDLGPLGGPDVLLTLETEGAPGGVEIRRPTLGTSAHGSAPAAAPTVPATLPGRPDVLLVVLDAARGDRFDGSYARRTHPRIDEMFADGVAFREAFAECPSTVCSLPNLITGVGFLRGGDTFAARRLSPDLVTLAESLRATGYRTVGLSANPNNSRSRGLDQGFDEFRELWGANPHHGPFGMSTLAVAAIESQPAGEPLFLQLHYLPPHEPYEPRPEYDLFRDRTYVGTVHPRMSLRPFGDGARLLHGTDLDQLVALYDGNLLMADAAVGRVFDALRARGRWDGTLAVLTADHGEAFMEHGRLGHNTTVHDEMLHVPLLVRLPGGARPAHDPDRLAAVADVVPTVLARLGLAVPVEVTGVDLFAAPRDGERDRVLFARTSHPQRPWLAARSGRWKTIVWPANQVQELYDLGTDPGETRNRLLEDPFVFVGLGLLLRDHLAATAHRRAGQTVELSDEEKRALRALGYVE